MQMSEHLKHIWELLPQDWRKGYSISCCRVVVNISILSHYWLNCEQSWAERLCDRESSGLTERLNESSTESTDWESVIALLFGLVFEKMANNQMIGGECPTLCKKARLECPQAVEPRLTADGRDTNGHKSDHNYILEAFGE